MVSKMLSMFNLYFMLALEPFVDSPGTLAGLYLSCMNCKYKVLTHGFIMEFVKDLDILHKTLSDPKMSFSCLFINGDEH